jgi:hypothetical protein
MGISRLLNGVLDGDQPAPAFRIQATGENTLISWSATADYVLEVSESLAAPRWETEVSVRETFDGEFKITRPADAQTRFFRLRRL